MGRIKDKADKITRYISWEEMRVRKEKRRVREREGVWPIANQLKHTEAPQHNKYICQGYRYPQASQSRFQVPQTRSVQYVVPKLVVPTHKQQTQTYAPLTSRFPLYTWNIPNSHGGIQGGRDDKVLRWVEPSAHHIVVVSSQDGHTRATLPIPDSYCLVIRGW